MSYRNEKTVLKKLLENYNENKEEETVMIIDDSGFEKEVKINIYLSF